METVTFSPGTLTLASLRRVANGSLRIKVTQDPRVVQGARTVEHYANGNTPAYGINTGFGRLARTHIPNEQLALLQKNLVMSHAVGVGKPLCDAVVRVALTLKIASLSHGYSGVRPILIETLETMLEEGVLPVIPEKGSVGASGDLAPLAHLATTLLGIGSVKVNGRTLGAAQWLASQGKEPLELAPKEGLALLNGTQISTAIALVNLFGIENLLASALVTGALSVDAAAGSLAPFDPRIHAVRGHRGQIDTARAYRELLDGSGIAVWHQDCDKVQDPYSLRCQPQVMGAILDSVRAMAATLLIEANGVSDNPLVFPETDDVLSGGNFHAEPIALAADSLAVAVAEIGALAERRIALLVDSSLSGLPPFLTKDGGINSGFMIAHVTAAALASENKSLAHPASVDSLPTSANQEDHVSMATFAARRLGPMVENVAHILGIELLAAVQGIELRAPITTSPLLAHVLAAVRERVPHYDIDHYMAPDLQVAFDLITEGTIAAFAPPIELPSYGPFPS